MKFLTFIFGLILSTSVFAQNSNLDKLNEYFLKDNLSERDSYHEDHYKNLIPNELCEEFFKIKFNVCEKMCFSIKLIENENYNIYIVGRTCCAGGMCEWETLFTLDKNGVIIDKLRYSQYFADLTEKDKLIGSIHENIIVTVKIDRKYDDYGDRMISERIKNSYYKIDSVGKIYPLIENFRKSKNRKYSFTSERFVSIEELDSMRYLDLGVMRNEIFADYGYSFKTEKWQDYFKQFDWYKPLNDNEKINDKLNAIEKVNIKLIVAEELEREK